MFKYSDKVLDHFRNPRNLGEIKNPDGQATVRNPICGDVMEMTIKIDQNKEGEEIVEEIKFKTLGCGAAVATSSMGTTMIKGKTLEEALELTNEEVAQALGGLPATKLHCSNLAVEAIHQAIADYRKKKKKKRKKA